MAEQKKVYLRNYTSILLSNFIDSYEGQSLSDQVVDVFQHFYGGRSSSQVTPELKLAGLCLYYSSLFLFSSKVCTIGQSFTGLTMAKESQTPITTNNSIKTSIFTDLDRTTIQSVLFLKIIVPYLIDRKEHISSSLNELVTILCANENDVSVSSQSPPNNISTPPTTTSESNSLFSIVIKALQRSWTNIAHTTTSRSKVLIDYLHDIHSFFFLLDGK